MILVKYKTVADRNYQFETGNNGYCRALPYSGRDNQGNASFHLITRER